MTTTIEIDGVEVHADDEGQVILDERGEPTPAYVCLCAAHSSSECCCGAWDRPLPEDEPVMSIDF